MDKEAIEKIALLHYCEYMGWDYRKTSGDMRGDMRKEMCARAERTLKLIGELGYRKLPQEKPRLLQPFDVTKIIKEYLMLQESEEIPYELDQYYPISYHIARTQLDICIKHYEGE